MFVPYALQGYKHTPSICTKTELDRIPWGKGKQVGDWERRGKNKIKGKDLHRPAMIKCHTRRSVLSCVGWGWICHWETWKGGSRNTKKHCTWESENLDSIRALLITGSLTLDASSKFPCASFYVKQGYKMYTLAESRITADTHRVCNNIS